MDRKIVNPWSFIDNVSSKKYSKALIFTIFIFIFLLFSSFFIITKKDIFPLAIFILSFVFIFLFRKYRIFFILFAMCFYPFLKPKNLFFGSYLTILLAIYALIILFELLFNHKIKTLIKAKKEICLILSLCFVIFLSYFINNQQISFLKIISFFLYLSIPIFAAFDSHFDDKKKIIFYLSIFVLLSNLFAFFFFYINKNYLENFITIVCPNFLTPSGKINELNLRFTGLMIDPNFNSFLIMIVIALQCRYWSKTKNGLFWLIISILFVFFALLTQSKTFILIFSIFIFAFLIRFGIKKNCLLLILLCISSLALLLAISTNLSFIKPIVERFLMVDTRKGLLNGLTTGRYELQSQFLSKLLSNPKKLYFGNGLYSSENSGHCSHNLFIDCIYDFGFIGTILFVTYCLILLNSNKKITFYKMLILITILFYSLSIDIRSDVFIYLLFCLIRYSENQCVSFPKTSFAITI